jgi:hypothetical protein
MSNKKIKLNPLDQLIANLVSEFLKIENFSLLYENSKAKQIFNFLVFRISDLVSYKTLVINSFLPAVSKEIAITKSHIQNSIYKSFIDKNNTDISDSYFETIRMAYVVVFHKYESFATELKSLMDIYSDDIEDKQGYTFEQFCKNHFNFKFTDWTFTRTVGKINWICNCIKHYDSKPLKSNPPIEFEYADPSEKMKITKEQFIEDVKYLNESMIIILRISFFIHQYWLSIDSNRDAADFGEDYKKLCEENAKKIYDIVQQYIEVVKAI